MRILFITSTRIGDAVLTTGLLRHLVAAHPGARLTIVCGPDAAPLFARVPGVVRVIGLRKRKANGHWLRLWLACLPVRWDLIVNLRGTPIVYALWARARANFRGTRAGSHKVEQFGRVLRLDPPPAPLLWTGAEDEADAARLLPDGGPILAIGPAARWPIKEWPAERFAQLVGRLTAPDGPLPGARLAIFAGPGEAGRAQQAGAGFAGGPVTHLFDLPLPRIAACLRRCTLFIGNDSGLMHMAAAVGTPTLGLFGPTNPIHYAPWGPHAAHVRAAEAAAAPGGDLASQRARMMALTVDAVEQAARALLARHPPAAG